MKIVVTKDIYDRLIDHAKRETPIEACGYMGGEKSNIEGDETLFIKEVYEMTNVDKSEEHFAFDPREQFKAAKDAREKGLDLVAVYHSHPATPARPSEEDIKLAYDPNITYVIVSLAEDEGDVKAFRIKNAEVKREELEVV